MLRKIDTWIGKHLFIPPIIKFCQITKIKPSVIATYGFVIAFTLVVGTWQFGGVFNAIFFVFSCITLAAYVFLAATYRFLENVSAESLFLGRLYSYVGFVYTAIYYKTFGTDQIYLIVECMILLIAFFALEIKTIPPTKKKQAKQNIATTPA